MLIKMRMRRERLESAESGLAAWRLPPGRTSYSRLGEGDAAPRERGIGARRPRRCARAERRVLADDGARPDFGRARAQHSAHVDGEPPRALESASRVLDGAAAVRRTSDDSSPREARAT